MKDCKKGSCKPGPSKKKKKAPEPTIYKDIRDCNLVIEARDARLPVSSRVGFLSTKFASKPRVIFLTKSDLVSTSRLKEIRSYFNGQGIRAYGIKSLESPGKLNKVFQELVRDFLPKNSLLKIMRVLIVGLPNVGKSTLINALRKRKVARVGNMPGITKGRQWIKLSRECYLLDTPGVATLAHKGNEEQRKKFGICKMISEKEYDFEELAKFLLEKAHSQELLLRAQNKLPDGLKICKELGGPDLGFWLERIGRKQSFLLTGDRVDLNRASRYLFESLEKHVLPHMDLDETKA